MLEAAAVSVITPSEGNCLSRGVVAALEFVGRSSAKENTITALVASSRCDETCQPECPDVTEELLDNALRGISSEPRLNAIVVTPQSCAEAERALEELVERFGGEIGRIRN